jgi:hypothetical protein
MRKQYPTVRRRGAKAVTCNAVTWALTVAALAITLGTAGNAFAAEDEEDVPLDTRVLRQLLKDWGLQRGGSDPGIDYRERPPLVVPPSRNLPKPEEDGPVARNPAWPNDPDVNRRKREAAAEKARLKAGVSAEEQSRVLRPNELDQSGRKASTGPAAPGRTAEDTARPMSQSELGSKNVFRSMFSSFNPNKPPEVAPFTGEPPRTSMTAPPIGYQTPSPNQPYGLGPAKDHYAVPKAEDLAVGTAQQK